MVARIGPIGPGRRAEARTHLRLAVALDPRSSLYRGALQRLGTGPVASPGPEAGPGATDPEPSDDEPPAGTGA